MRKFKLANPDDFSDFEIDTMGAVCQLAVSIQNVARGAMVGDDADAEAILAVLAFMRSSFPKAHWTVADD